MTASDTHHHFDLMPAIHLYRELASAPADRHQVLSRDNNFALGDDDAVDCPAVDNAGDSAAQISSYDIVHDVSRQADNVRARRFSVDHTHLDGPPHAANANCG